MKKLLWLLILFLIPCLSASAEAQDIAGKCSFTFASGSRGQGDMRDQSYLTYYNGRYLEVKTPEEAPCYGVYLCLSGDDVGYCIQTQDAEGNWEIFRQDDRGYVNSYLRLPGLQHFRIALSSGEKISIAELRLLGEGEIPKWVQDWKDFEGKADLMVLSAHADDELLFFGGTIPYYTAERGMKVIVCYMTHQTPCRRNELLDGLWHCGVREYPSMGVFPDGKNNSLESNYDFWGKEKVHQYVTALFRKYQPEVVVTHDVKGEYGHGAHKTTADTAKLAIELAADKAYAPELGESWQVKKLMFPHRRY